MVLSSTYARSAAVAAALLATASPAAAQAGSTPPAAAAEAPAVRTVRAAGLETRRPQIDGRLDEEVWRTAEVATGFVQREPEEGSPARDETEVRFAVDGQALYIGARMRSRDPSAIQGVVARRDRETPSEQIIVSLDTYRDRRTAYTFAVNVAGVRSDHHHPADSEGRIDRTYDPVWEAATAIDADGWTAEIRIPFSQLRFNESDGTWGVNLVRVVPSTNERSYWSLVGRKEAGWSSRMGTLTGLEGVRPARRVEVLPYVAMDGRLQDEVDPRNPFAHQREGALRAGADLKVGLGSSLTLDATINPDFGQVEADPAEVNLSAFETFFPERRPFFLEGASYLGGRGTFYSRRIGARPIRARGGTYAQERDNSTILGAAKLTGRLPSKLSVGALAALTAREEVATYDTLTAQYGNALVAPQTLFGVATVQQEFGRDGSTIAASVTAVDRDLEADSPLAPLLAERAYSGLLDGRIRWAGGKYDLTAFLAVSRIEGDSSAIRAQQLSPRRYFQRPDADQIRLANRTALAGTWLVIGHSKMAGKHWLWDVDYAQSSPGLELNDAGASGAVDQRSLSGALRYRETVPGRYLRGYTIGARTGSQWNFDGDQVRQSGVLIGNVLLKNFWSAAAAVMYAPSVLSDRLTRGGPLMRRAEAWQGRLMLSNASSSRTRWRGEMSYFDDELGGWALDVGGGLALRHGARWELSVDPRYLRAVTSRQHVINRPGGSAATFGQRNIFAFVDRRELVARVRLNYAIRPDLTLESYLEPFASSGHFRDFGELTAARAKDLRVYGEAGTTIQHENGGWTVTDGAQRFRIPDRDFDVLSFRSNAVLRWEWRPGSTMFVVWQQNRAGHLEERGEVGPGSLVDALSARGDNLLAVKISYWFPL